jgi:hypothetical protein
VPDARLANIAPPYTIPTKTPTQRVSMPNSRAISGASTAAAAVANET